MARRPGLVCSRMEPTQVRPLGQLTEPESRQVERVFFLPAVRLVSVLRELKRAYQHGFAVTAPTRQPGLQDLWASVAGLAKIVRR